MNQYHAAHFERQTKDPLPLRALNGGWYTGEPFTKDAPWANVPVIPDASYMIHYNLRSANPPPGAITQYPSGNRPGNNTQIMYGVVESKGPYNMLMTREVDHDKLKPCTCYKCQMSKYLYL